MKRIYSAPAIVVNKVMVNNAILALSGKGGGPDVQDGTAEESGTGDDGLVRREWSIFD